MRKSTIIEEQIFKVNNDENENENLDKSNQDNINIDISLQNSLRKSKNDILNNNTDKRNIVIFKSNLFNNSLKDSNITINTKNSDLIDNNNNVNKKFDRSGVRKSTIKVTKNYNKIFDEKISSNFMHQIDTLIKK